MDETTVRETLRRYIVREIIRNPKLALQDDDGIITKWRVDSFALAELGVFIEQEFGVYIPDPDLTVEKMDTLNLVVARVLRG